MINPTPDTTVYHDTKREVEADRRAASIDRSQARQAQEHLRDALEAATAREDAQATRDYYALLNEMGHGDSHPLKDGNIERLRPMMRQLDLTNAQVVRDATMVKRLHHLRRCLARQAQSGSSIEERESQAYDKMIAAQQELEAETTRLRKLAADAHDVHLLLSRQLDEAVKHQHEIEDILQATPVLRDIINTPAAAAAPEPSS